jgi:hypothetical protein
MHAIAVHGIVITNLLQDRSDALKVLEGSCCIVHKYVKVIVGCVECQVQMLKFER